MAAPSNVSRLPWRVILTWLLAAVVVFWLAGFAAGLILRIVAPWAAPPW